MISNAAILGLGTAVPDRVFTQEEAYRLCKYPRNRFQEIFRHIGVETRHLFFDDASPNLQETPDELNARYLRGAMQLAGTASRKALYAADLQPEKIGLIVSTSCTGYLCPDLATRLVHPLELKENVERAGIQGMGCGGVMPALQRAADFVMARGGYALVVAAEICSAAYFFDEDPETAIGNALCGDGAAALVLGPPRKGLLSPRIEKFHTKLWPEHLPKVGFSLQESRLRIILKKEIRNLAPKAISQAVEEVLEENSLAKGDIAYWLIHPGGKKITDKLPVSLGLPLSAFEAPVTVLRRFGNLSSPTVLFVLEEALRNRAPRRGDRGILLALGPGFVAESALISWQ